MSLGQLLLSAALFALSASPALAGGSLRHAGNFGLGLGGGTYGGGLSAKYWLGDGSALQGTLNGSSSSIYGISYSTLVVSGDYLIEMPTLTETEGLEIGWNLGPGAGVSVASAGGSSAVGLAISGVAGLEFDLKVIPLDIVLEYRPAFSMGNGYTALTLVNLGGHIRYYFG